MATKSEDVELIVCAVSFQDFQPMWSSTNVTDRQTTCDRKTALCTIGLVHRAVKINDHVVALRTNQNTAVFRQTIGTKFNFNDFSLHRVRRVAPQHGDCIVTIDHCDVTSPHSRPPLDYSVHACLHAQTSLGHGCIIRCSDI